MVSKQLDKREAAFDLKVMVDDLLAEVGHPGYV